MPFFILQPLVENALHHGIGSHAGAVTVEADAPVSALLRLAKNGGEQLPTDTAAAQFRHDIEAFDFRYPRGERFQPDQEIPGIDEPGRWTERWITYVESCIGYTLTSAEFVSECARARPAG